MSKVWFITGCSTGFGRELSKQALEQRNKVIVTSRKTADIEDIVKDHPVTSIAVQLNVTNATDIAFITILPYVKKIWF